MNSPPIKPIGPSAPPHDALRHYSYLPVDIGFDPRAQGMPVELPADAASITLPSDDDSPVEYRGTHTELAACLAYHRFEVGL